MPKLGVKVPHPSCYWPTSFKFKRSCKVIRPINVDTYRAPYLQNGKVYELWTWFTDGRRRPASATGAVASKVKGQDHKTSWSVWAVLAQWPINRKRIVVISPKLVGGYPVTRARPTLRTSFKVKRSNVRVTDRLTHTQSVPYLPNGKA